MEENTPVIKIIYNVLEDMLFGAENRVGDSFFLIFMIRRKGGGGLFQGTITPNCELVRSKKFQNEILIYMKRFYRFGS